MTGSGSNEFVSPGAFPMWDGNGGNYQLQIGGDGSGNYIIGDSTGMGAYKSMLYFGMGWRDAGIGTGSGEQPTVWVGIQMATELLHSTDQAYSGLNIDATGNLTALQNFKAATYGFTSTNQTINGTTVSFKVAHGLRQHAAKSLGGIGLHQRRKRLGNGRWRVLDISSVVFAVTPAWTFGVFGDATYAEITIPWALVGNEAYIHAQKRGGGGQPALSSSMANFALVIHAI